jgi:hypothetical protein
VFELAAAITGIASGELGRIILMATEEAAEDRKLLGGRNALLIVYKHFNTNAEAGPVYIFRT